MLNPRAVITLGGEMKMFNRICLVLIMLFTAIKAYAQGPVYNFNFNNGEVNAPIQTNAGAQVIRPDVAIEDESRDIDVSPKSETSSIVYDKPTRKKNSSIVIGASQGADFHIIPSTAVLELDITSDFSLEAGIRFNISEKLYSTLLFTSQKYYYDFSGSGAGAPFNQFSLESGEDNAYGGKIILGYDLNLSDRVNLSIAGGYEYQTFNVEGEIVEVDDIRIRNASLSFGPSFDISDTVRFSLSGYAQRSRVQSNTPLIDHESNTNFGGSTQLSIQI